MNKSSTEYLDELVLDDKSLIIRDSIESIKNYCGLFGFVLGVSNDDALDDRQKAELIKNIIKASIEFLRKKYEANLEIYNRQACENLETGKLFKSLSELPAKMREDFEAGLSEAEEFMYIEIRDILKILNMNLDI